LDKKDLEYKFIDQVMRACGIGKMMLAFLLYDLKSGEPVLDIFDPLCGPSKKP
jgi:hypothetical protein